MPEWPAASIIPAVPTPKYFALIPAAGTGSRIGEDRPKQYLALDQRPMLHYAIARFCNHPGIARTSVVLGLDDTWFSRFDWSPFSENLDVLRCGGATRAQSVLNGLSALAPTVDENDWILVHDAARPCLSDAMIDKLIRYLGVDAVGGLLALPVSDTLKRGDQERVIATEPRDKFWLAQTPQMFRFGLLWRALHSADLENVTDEASAVEMLGLQPKLVVSDASNLKVTHRSDLALAEMLLRHSKGT